METKLVRTSEHLEAHSRHKYHQYIKQISMKQEFILDYYIWKHHHHQTKEKTQTKQQKKDKTKQKRQKQNQEQNNKPQQQ